MDSEKQPSLHVPNYCENCFTEELQTCPSCAKRSFCPNCGTCGNAKCPDHPDNEPNERIGGAES